MRKCRNEIVQHIIAGFLQVNLYIHILKVYFQIIQIFALSYINLDINLSSKVPTLRVGSLREITKYYPELK